jgi:transposase InsO family protein
MRYACIDRRRHHYPVRLMCRLLGVSTSGYYAWRRRPESARAQRDRELLVKIRRVHKASKGVYGSPRVHAELVAEGVCVGRHKVAQLMRTARLRGCPKRRYRVTTQRDPSHPVARNLLKQNFTADGPNRRWASDITYIPTRQGWLFLAVVVDLYSRRIVGWSMSRWSDRHLVVNALRMAIEARQPAGPLIHHSDRGGQYSSDDFRNELAKHGIDCSMSSTGNCFDNAVVESFFGVLKRERVIRVRYRNREEARADLFEYIEVFYNRKRRHGYLGNISPVDFERKSDGSF